MSELAYEILRDPIVSWSLAIALAAILCSASVHKLSDVEGFKETLQNYNLLPQALVTIVAILLPFVELCAGVTMLWPTTSNIGAELASFLFISYAAAISINLLRGRDNIDCGCHWSSDSHQRLSWQLVARNGVLIGLSLSVMTSQSRALGGVDGLIIVVTSLSILLLYLIADRLIANHTQRRSFHKEYV